ncbi:MAG: hypothetical protein GXO71_06895 [Caldiserica bacterium]|nr:hypothetical protein [Caldisericota bacterium]
MRKVSCFFLVFTLFLVTLQLYPAEKNFGYKLVKMNDEIAMVELFSEGYDYRILPEVFRIGSYIGYFAAQDFTNKKEMTLKKFADVKVVMDEENKKGIKIKFILQDQEQRDITDYVLETNLEIRKGYPFLVMVSKLRYIGGGKAETGFNWGFSDGFKYYVIPEGRKVRAFTIVRKGLLSGRSMKIGKGAYPWVWFTDGKGKGLGMITDGMLVAGILGGELQVGVSDVPPKKKLASGESMDVVFFLLPTMKGYKPVKKMFEKIKGVSWETDKW